MARRNKEILSSIDSKKVFNAAFAGIVAYYVIDYLRLPMHNVQDLADALIYLVPAELAAFYLKEKAVKEIKKTKRKLSSGSRMKVGGRRSKERLKQKTIRFAVAIALLLILSVAIENNSQYRPYTHIKTSVAAALNGVAGTAEAFTGGGEVKFTVSDGQNGAIQNRLPEVSGAHVQLNQEQIIDKIHAVFGTQGSNAVQVATCESGLQSTIIGDQSLMFTDPATGEQIGDSVGIFQIRTGGQSKNGIWNRARQYGMTVEQFRTYLKNPHNNIAFAKMMYDQQGWGPWSCKP